MIKLKNKTDNDYLHEDTGVLIPAQGEVGLTYGDYLKMNTVEFSALLSSGDIVLWDGDKDVSSDIALAKANIEIQSSTVVGGGFSWKVVPENQYVIVPENQQMLVRGRIRVNGRLKIEGNVCLM